MSSGLKGLCHGILHLWFFRQQLRLAPIGMSRNYFEFFRVFEEIFQTALLCVYQRYRQFQENTLVRIFLHVFIGYYGPLKNTYSLVLNYRYFKETDKLLNFTLLSHQFPWYRPSMQCRCQCLTGLNDTGISLPISTTHLVLLSFSINYWSVRHNFTIFIEPVMHAFPVLLTP
jgi:hypothetical protein